ncbi:MAG: CopD family protein [bacterium]|nr:CopD family protein [bacterium]
MLLTIKSLHILSVMSWFAGLIYLGRLFIYFQAAALDDDAIRAARQTQLTLMARRLYNGICNPGIILSLFTGVWLAIDMDYFAMPWMHVKLTLVLGFCVLHFLSGRLLKQMITHEFIPVSETLLRILNESVTVLLVGIVFAVVTKDAIESVFAMIGFLALIAIGFTLYYGVKRTRKSN